jgi:hypothetical protein
VGEKETVQSINISSYMFILIHFRSSKSMCIHESILMSVIHINTHTFMSHCHTLPHTATHCFKQPHCRTAAHCRAHCHTLPSALPHTAARTAIHYQAHCRTLPRALRTYFRLHCHTLPHALLHTAALLDSGTIHINTYTFTYIHIN